MVTAALSPSRAADFMQCPLKYRFRVVDKLPEKPSSAAVRGTVVHAVLERLFDLPAPERTLPAARALLAPQWARLQEEEPELAALFAQSLDVEGAVVDVTGTDGAVAENPTVTPQPDAEAAWLSGAEKLLATYFELEDPTRLEPAERELYVEVPLDDGLILRGYVDRLDVVPGGDDAGAMRVVDYKTGRAPSEAFEAKALFQMKFYALVLWRMRGVVPRMLQLVYLGNGQVLRYSPDEADLAATERKVKALWQAIQRAASSGDWRATPSRLCDWCDHKPICPAWGGTPPPPPADALILAAGSLAGTPITPGLDED